MDFNITSKAADEIKKIMTQEQEDDLKLRIGVQGGGCSGLSYFMTIEQNQTENDRKINMHDINLIIDSKSAMYLDGTVVDFSDGLNGKGFVFNNPNAQRTCGCGSSFSV